MAGKVKIGIIGSRFEADIHAASVQIMPEEAEVVAVASPTPGQRRGARAASTASRAVFHDYREMLARARHRDGHRSPRPTACTRG